MSDRRGVAGVLLISFYLVFACFTWVNSLRPPQQVSAGKEVLSAKTIALPEVSDFPSLNKLLLLTNQVRTNQSLVKLHMNDTLNQLAQSRADDMAKRNYYAHQSPDGLYYYNELNGTPFDANYNCENLALASSLQPQIYLDQWLTSPNGHKECLLNPTVNSVGYGVARLSFGTPTTEDDSFVIVAVQANQPN